MNSGFAQAGRDCGTATEGPATKLSTTGQVGTHSPLDKIGRRWRRSLPRNPRQEPDRLKEIWRIAIKKFVRRSFKPKTTPCCGTGFALILPLRPTPAPGPGADHCGLGAVSTICHPHRAAWCWHWTLRRRNAACKRHRALDCQTQSHLIYRCQGAHCAGATRCAQFGGV